MSEMSGYWLKHDRSFGWIQNCGLNIALRVQKVPDFCLPGSLCPVSFQFQWFIRPLNRLHRGQTMLRIAITSSFSITWARRINKSPGGVSAPRWWIEPGGPWAKARAPRPEGRCLTEGERGWGPEGKVPSRGVTGWVGGGLCLVTEEGNPGASGAAVRRDLILGSRMWVWETTEARLTLWEEASDAAAGSRSVPRYWDGRCSGHSPSVRFMRCPSASVKWALNVLKELRAGDGRLESASINRI